LVSAPKDIIIVGCQWLHPLKHFPDGLMDRYKARLIVTEYTQTYGVDFFETF